MSTYININGTDRKVAPTKTAIGIVWKDGLAEIESVVVGFPRTAAQVEVGIQTPGSMLGFSKPELRLTAEELASEPIEIQQAMQKLNESLSVIFDYNRPAEQVEP